MNEVMNEAITLVNNGETEKGLDLLGQIQPTLHDEEKYMLADHYFGWGMVDKAEEIIEELHFLYPEETHISLFLAEIYLDLDKEEEAITLLNTVEPFDEDYPQALLLLADLYQMQGLPEVSEQKLKEAKILLPEESIIDFALGELYFHQAKYQKAITFFESVMKNRSTVSGIHIGQRLAECLSVTGSFEEAMTYYQQAVDEQTDLNTLFGYGVTAYQGGFYVTAIKQLTDLKDLDPHFTSLYLYLAKSYEQEGLLKESLDTVREGIKVDEFNKELYLYGGKTAIKNGLKDEAEQFLRESVALDPGHVEAALTLTNLFLQEERYDDVIDVISEIMKYGEEDPGFHWNLARAYHQKEQYTQALNHYQLAYNFFKDGRDFLEEYGYFLMEDGQRKDAKEVFERLNTLDPSNVEISEILLQLEDEF
ncbi:tetratricopeptide repeat protein [Metabacillus herbersteinensis]|uniref:Tetratricopeptide repeat protein n=1 Tax=Metabacillus herbersteinensis TaxID=283816 RepID=A0ABV6GDJ7_9BACI